MFPALFVSFVDLAFVVVFLFGILLESPCFLLPFVCQTLLDVVFFWAKVGYCFKSYGETCYSESRLVPLLYERVDISKSTLDTLISGILLLLFVFKSLILFIGLDYSMTGCHTFEM